MHHPADHHKARPGTVKHGKWLPQDLLPLTPTLSGSTWILMLDFISLFSSLALSTYN